MSRGPVAAAAGVGLALLVLTGGGLVGGCTYYPSVVDMGGVRLRPEEGRVVRAGNGQDATVYFKLNSTGKYGDVLKGAESPLARRAELRGPGGGRVTEVAIPGASVVTFDRGGPHIALADFTRALQTGEVIIVTLHFEKSGPLGLVTVVE
ncbi:MAG TPA: copper chaperone PCu(A)C [Methylomirabilota bacterium]|nr:copper chaperone PCu(A)C [Methylomirabilota bacterium]